MKWNYSTWVQNQSHGANICRLHSSWEKHSTSRTIVLIFYYGHLGLGDDPWAAGYHSKHINDKDVVLKYLIMFSKWCFHLRYSVLGPPTMLLPWKNGFVWEGQCPGKGGWTIPLFLLIDIEMYAGSCSVPLVTSLKVHII